MAAIALHPARTTIAAMSALVVAMSISRFAYTPILPVMIEQHAVTHELGAFLASANLLGYLAGAVIVSGAWVKNVRAATLKWSLLAIIVTLGVMAIPSAPLIWTVARFVSGVASALVFVLASSLVLDLRHISHTTALFSSVGAGIAIAGAAIGIGYAWIPAWTSGWYIATALGAILAVITVALLGEPAGMRTPVVHAGHERARLSAHLAIVFACYGIAGFAYVIPATFLVVLVAAVPALRAYAFSTWVIVGIVACVTTFIWGPLSARFGKRNTLTAALLLMALSCAVPIAGDGALTALGAAFTLGASFMSVSMLSIGLVRDLAPHESSRRIGQATAVFGVGQVAGPAFTGMCYGAFHSYAPAFITASVLVALASVCVAITLRGAQTA